jgi:hypothetical protein
VLGAEEFGGDSFDDGDEAGGEASSEEGFEFLELGEFLADGVGAFGVVGVVEFWKLEFCALIVHLSFSDSGKDFSKAENCGCG